jgi:hypothetical protein
MIDAMMTPDFKAGDGRAYVSMNILVHHMPPANAIVTEKLSWARPVLMHSRKISLQATTQSHLSVHFKANRSAAKVLAFVPEKC